ncbi:MAG: hypothetical protein SFW09_21795 [Hyphomicrobiaceae bacterium]|nr:hypothetical protein [Hyphomicrobiaceae bacterium]
MTDDETVRRARDLGLEKLARHDAGELTRALEAAEALAKRMPKDIHWTEEPAHVLSLAARKGSRS